MSYRKRKSKCDGNTPACAACSQVYGTECIYDPNSDHRRKGVYKKDADALKTRETTLQTLIQAILNYPEDEVPALISQIRTCESLDDVAEAITAKENGVDDDEDDDADTSPIMAAQGQTTPPMFEQQLGTKMGELRLDDGSVRYIGGTSHLLFLNSADAAAQQTTDQYQQQDDPITSWTDVVKDPELVMHLLNMYFTWHYTFFTCVPKSLFYRDFLLGKPPSDTRRKTEFCTPLLVNAMLALGCHFTSLPGARANPEDSATAGDHFFKEAKRLLMENDELEKPKLTNVQALALMSVREAGCGREAKGWVYSGMSFRMAFDMGLHLDSDTLAIGTNTDRGLDEGEADARRITFWGCFLFDKCWSNYLGRLPQLPSNLITCPKFDVFPDEDSSNWAPCTDSGFSTAHLQPSRTRAVALQISSLCEISSDLIKFFYNPGETSDLAKPKGKQAELKKLSEIHSRLESWRRDLPKEMEPKEGGLSSVLIMHMFFQILFIHLFRPFLKYNAATSPLPSTISPRKVCTHAATMISKLLRLYKRSFGLRQIPNICVYIAHSACTIHLLNLPNKDARRDIIHGVKHLEEIAEGWLCARRNLGILSTLTRQWAVDLPEEAAAVLARTDAKFGPYSIEQTSPSAKHDAPSPVQSAAASYAPLTSYDPQQHTLQQPQISKPPSYFRQPNAPITGQQHSRQQVPQQQQQPQLQPPQQRRQQTPSRQDLYGTMPSKPTDRMPFPRASNLASNPSFAASTASPSDMFGGVEQLLRESSDWVFHDQASLASGLGNWGLQSGSSWTHGLGDDGLGNAAASGSPSWAEVGMSPASVVDGQGQAQGQFGMVGLGNTANIGAGDVNGNANVMSFNGLGYEEEGWYR